MSNSLLTKCLIHNQKEIKYICFDPDCNKNTKICIICVKTLHSSCKSQLIIRINEIKSKVEFKRSNVSNADEIRLIKLLFNRQTTTILTSLKINMNNLTNTMTEINNNIISKNNILNMIANNQVKLTKNIDLFTLSSKYSGSNEDVQYSLRCYH